MKWDHRTFRQRAVRTRPRVQSPGVLTAFDTGFLSFELSVQVALVDGFGARQMMWQLFRGLRRSFFTRCSRDQFSMHIRSSLPTQVPADEQVRSVCSPAAVSQRLTFITVQHMNLQFARHADKTPEACEALCHWRVTIEHLSSSFAKRSFCDEWFDDAGFCQTRAL